MRLVKRLATLSLGVTTTVLGTASTPAEAEVDPTLAPATAAWLSSAAQCEKLSHVDCAVAEDGWALAVTSPIVTVHGGSDCVDLPADHGRFVSYRANAVDRGRFPSAVAQLGDGGCGSPEHPGNTVASGSRARLQHFTDGHVRHLRSGGFTGQATYYPPGPGACGPAHRGGSLIAALPASMFDSSLCGRKVRVTRDGPTGRSEVVVTVTDRCAGCGYGSIDLSTPAFARIAKLSQGRVKVDWQLAD